MQGNPVADNAAVTRTDVATYTRERPGMSAFALEEGVVYHAYSTYARGLDGLWGMYQWLDRALKGAPTRRASGGGGTTSMASAEPIQGSCCSRSAGPRFCARSSCSGQWSRGRSSSKEKASQPQHDSNTRWGCRLRERVRM